MALPTLVKFIYNNGTDEVIRKGKKIHSLNTIEIVEHDELASTAVFRVKDDSYATWYKVYIQNYKNEKTLAVRCTCAYNLGDVCRHRAAALFQLQELLDRNLLSNVSVNYDQKHTLIKMRNIDLKTIKMLTDIATYEQAENYLRTNKPKIEKAENEKVQALIEGDGLSFPVVIRKNEERNFDTSCNCTANQSPLCIHKTILFLHLLNIGGANYFDSIRNWDNDKNKLLALYGFSLSDDLNGKFEFTYKDGKPFLKVLDPSIKRVNQLPTEGLKPAPIQRPQAAITTNIPKEEEKKETIIDANTQKRLGVVFNFNNATFPFFEVNLIEGYANDEGKKMLPNVAKLDLQKFVDISQYNEADGMLLQLVRKMQKEELKKYVERNSPFAKMWDSIIPDETDDSLTDEAQKHYLEYLYPKLRQLFAQLTDAYLVYCLPQGSNFIYKNLEPIHITEQTISPAFDVAKKGKNYLVECYINIQKQPFALDENECSSPYLFLHNSELLLWSNEEDIAEIIDFMDGASLQIDKAEWENYLATKLIPLSRTHQVNFAQELILETKEGEPQAKIQLLEKGEYLVFNPEFNYKGYAVKDKDGNQIYVPQKDKIVVIKRNATAEAEFLSLIENLHSNFVRPQGTQTLALKGGDVLKNNWYFLFMDTMKEQNIEVEGFDVLKNFKFNAAKPSTKIFINSDTDWFDAKVQISFGEQQITIADVKKALANKQQFVPLADGTLGILPEEWIKRYSLLFRMGEGKQDKLKISKYHFSVIDELYEERDETELFFQLEEKYDVLKNNYKIKEIDPPAHLTETLRPYQVSGFHWLNYLSEIGWGGILADDMGLGKTIQALSFLSDFKTKNKRLLSIVVCPTTLIYNWENEIRKFAPNLTYHIHHGGDRQKVKKLIEEKNVIITTYGTLRSDIKFFVDMQWDCVILDESQAIKNPSSKVTKAATLLNAKHKLCMSGTPLQNNTFDIYAQMNFLNPGMLGSMEYFKNEFSLPIDKLGDKERKDHLRKILYPFILRRTKEQVAKDLPAKTEMILWCEMEEEQRAIYDAFRNDYRENILGSIETKGLQRSQLTILQGLMKLRQICDSPAIMNSDEVYPNVSVKIDELARELEENCGDHKVLVFSQFLGMLHLIRKKLDEQQIPYEYFDGSTSANDRKIAIENFQDKEHVRVFLISLKAGGVGLNLTAADYVYIVDPWWNPAVEQQAIDRTHRIGQTKNIFAYRMICKDTVEAKIIQLQERKRQLAKDIVADDDTFVKSLSREDVEYLFS
jgi:SNF2 family DNA or RNA helicase